MKKRRRSNSNTQAVDTSKLDIFLDVLMNTLGIFILIAMLLSLQISVAQRLVLEITRPPKEDKQPYFFEIRGDQIIDLTETRNLVKQKVDELYVEQAACFLEPIEQYESCLTEVIDKFARFQVNTNFYQVQVNWEQGNFIYDPVDEEVVSRGETGELQKISLGAENPSSQVESYLDEIDDDKYYLVFITRPDGFSTYRQVREMAMENNFEVGWEPYPYRQPLIFSGSGEGRQIGVQ